MTDPRREWMLCGRLPEAEKIALRRMIREAVPKYYVIFEVIDGNQTIIPEYDEDGSMVNIYKPIFSSIHRPWVYPDPWIHCSHNKAFLQCLENAWLIRDELSYNPSPVEADYVVLLETIDREDYIGKGIFQTVAQIIQAEVSMGKSNATVVWMKSAYHLPRYFDGPPCHAEMCLINPNYNKPYQFVAYYAMRHDIISLDSMTIDDVFECFRSINALIPVEFIWRTFCRGLMMCIRESMTEIIKAIAASRQNPNRGVSLFWSVPIESPADVTVITKK